MRSDRLRDDGHVSRARVGENAGVRVLRGEAAACAAHRGRATNGGEVRPTLAGYNTRMTLATINNNDFVLALDETLPIARLWRDGAVSHVQVTTPGVTLVG